MAQLLTEQELWDNEVEFLQELEPDKRARYAEATRARRVLDFLGRPITYEFWERFDRAIAIANGLLGGRA